MDTYISYELSTQNKLFLKTTRTSTDIPSESKRFWEFLCDKGAAVRRSKLKENKFVKVEIHRVKVKHVSVTTPNIALRRVLVL